jgi:hypothetical protein
MLRSWRKDRIHVRRINLDTLSEWVAWASTRYTDSIFSSSLKILPSSAMQLRAGPQNSWSTWYALSSSFRTSNHKPNRFMSAVLQSKAKPKLFMFLVCSPHILSLQHETPTVRSMSPRLSLFRLEHTTTVWYVARSHLVSILTIENGQKRSRSWLVFLRWSVHKVSNA